MADATETSDETADELAGADAATLGDYLDEPYGEIRARSRELFSSERYERVSPDIGMKDYREQVLDWARPVSYTHLTLPTIYSV